MNIQNLIITLLSVINFVTATFAYTTHSSQEDEGVCLTKGQNQKSIPQSISSNLDLTITHLDFHNQNHDSSFFIDKILSKSWPHLSHLDFSGNSLRNFNYKIQSSAFNRFPIYNDQLPQLEFLNLSRCHLGDLDMESFSKIFMPSLTDLNVCDNRLTKLSFVYSAHWKSNLIHLNLSQNSQQSFIESFNGYGPAIHYSGFETSEIISMFKVMPQLTHLSLNWLEFTFKDPNFFQRLYALKDHLKLQMLNLTGAFVDRHGIGWLEKIIFETPWSLNLTDLQCAPYERAHLDQLIQKIEMLPMGDRVKFSYISEFKPLWPAYWTTNAFSYFSWVPNPLNVFNRS